MLFIYHEEQCEVSTHILHAPSADKNMLYGGVRTLRFLIIACAFFTHTDSSVTQIGNNTLNTGLN